jgi:hypothetical protein
MSKIIIDFNTKDADASLKVENCSGEQIVRAYAILKQEIEKETGISADKILDMLIEENEKLKKGKQ